MKRKLSYGYPLPSEEAAEIEDFSFIVGEIVVGEDSNQEPAWDYETPITCTVSLNADLPRILEESGLQDPGEPEDGKLPRLGVALSWSSSATKLRGASNRKELTDGSNSLDLVVDGQILGGTLSVKAIITLLEDIQFDDDRIAPSSEGTLLWTSDELHLPLEGSGTRFTMTPVSFKEAGVEPTDAMWLVQLADQMETPISSGVRVLVNVANPITKSMLENPNTPEAESWQQVLETEVMTLLVHHGVAGLRENDFDTPMEIGSLGEGIQAIMGSFFPNETPADLTNELPRITATMRAAVFNRKES